MGKVAGTSNHWHTGQPVSVQCTSRDHYPLIRIHSHGHEHEHAQQGRGGRDHLAGRRVRHVLPRRRVNNVAFTSTNKLEAANKARYVFDDQNFHNTYTHYGGGTRFHLHYLERLAL
jgi:hypothetical protein